MKSMVFLCCVVLFLTGCTKKTEQKITEQKIPMQEITVYYEEENSQKVPFEPENGVLLLGAFIKEDKNIESIEKFEEITKKSHDIYGFTATLTEEFPMMDILECYVKEKIPLLALYPPDRNAPFQEIWLEEAAEKISQYHIPILVDFYPNGADYGTAKAYCDYYQKARKIFRKKAPNAIFIWSINIDHLDIWEQYYPKDVDWVGLSIYENGGEQGKDISEKIEKWYSIFQKEKPLLLSQVGISHYSDKNAKYTEKEASEEITKLYQNLNSYPQIKGIVYRSINFAHQKIKAIEGENYSLIENQKVLEAYQKAIEQNRKRQNKNWYKSSSKGYIKDNILYLSEDTVEKEMNININQNGIFLNGKRYVQADDIKNYQYFYEENAVFFYKQSY